MLTMNKLTSVTVPKQDLEIHSKRVLEGAVHKSLEMYDTRCFM